MIRAQSFGAIVADATAAAATAVAAAADATAAYEAALAVQLATVEIAAGVSNQAFIVTDWPGYPGPMFALIAPDGLGGYVLVWSSRTSDQELEDLGAQVDAVAGGTSAPLTIDIPGANPGSRAMVDSTGLYLQPPSDTLRRSSTQVAAKLEAGVVAETIAPFSFPMYLLPRRDTLWLWIVFAQSWGLGSGGNNSKVYTSQEVAAGMGWYPYTYMPNNGVIPNGGRIDRLVNAYEQLLPIGITPSGETGFVRMIARIHDRVFAKTGDHIRQAVISQARGGTTAGALGPGTFNGEGIKKNVERVVAWAAAQGDRGWNVVVPGVIWIQGHADAGTTQSHRHQLMGSRWLDIWNDELKPITLQNRDIKLYMTQDPVRSYNFMTELGQSQAQLGLAMNDSRVHLVGGGVQIDCPDGTHPDNRGYVWFGEAIAEDIADNEFLGGMTLPYAKSCWQSGDDTFDFDIGAQNPLNINTTESVIGLTGIRGYLGCEAMGRGGSPLTITNFAVLDTSDLAPQRTILRATLSAPYTGHPSDVVFGFGMRNNDSTNGGYRCDAYATVGGGGSITGIVFTNGGDSWAPGNGNQIAIGGAGTGASATLVVTGDVATGYDNLIGGSGYGGTQTYAVPLRGAAGAHVGGRHCFELLSNSWSSLGWDSLEDVSPSNPSPADPTQNPRPINRYLAGQFIRAQVSADPPVVRV